MTSLITFLLKVGCFWPRLDPLYFPLCTICSRAGLQLPPVKKQIVLAQGQDRSPGAPPASHGLTRCTEGSPPGCCCFPSEIPTCCRGEMLRPSLLSSRPLSSSVPSIWLGLKARESGEEVKVLAVSLDLPAVTRRAQACQHTGLCIHRSSASRQIVVVASE